MKKRNFQERRKNCTEYAERYTFDHCLYMAQMSDLIGLPLLAAYWLECAESFGGLTS